VKVEGLKVEGLKAEDLKVEDAEVEGAALENLMPKELLRKIRTPIVDQLRMAPDDAYLGSNSICNDIFSACQIKRPIDFDVQCRCTASPSYTRLLLTQHSNEGRCQQPQEWLAHRQCEYAQASLIHHTEICRLWHFGRSTTPREPYPQSPTNQPRYLEREGLRKCPSSNTALLRPYMVFMLMQIKDPLTLKEALPNFSKTTHIFLPITGACNVSIPKGGSHWSLLIVSIIDSIAFHYDPLMLLNSNKAVVVTQKISQLLGLPLPFTNIDTPQQVYRSDCGVYVCILMRHLLLTRLLGASASWGEKVDMSMSGKLVDVPGGRKELLKLIETFRKEGEGRRWLVAVYITRPYT